MPLILILLCISCCVLTYLISNYFAVPRSVPGPCFARFTDLWRAYHQRKGRLRSKLLALHAQHGEVIRYGIRSVSVTDPKAIELIYESRDHYLVAHSYDVLVGISNGREVPSVISTRDEIGHRQLRRSVVHAFTVRGVEPYEGSIDATIYDLINVLERRLHEAINLPDLLLQYSMDAAYRMSFSESLGCLESGGDVDGSMALVRDRLQYWGQWSSLPWLERLLYRNPWAMRQSQGKTPGTMVTRAVEKMTARTQEKNDSQHDWLNHFLSVHKTNPTLLDQQGVVSLIMSTISGAGDTTATTLTAIIYNLIKHPAKLTRLRTELTNAGIDGSEIPTMEAVSRASYLAAVIKESMRLFPLLTYPAERLVPPGGGTIAGHFFAGGTTVGVFTFGLHLNKTIYGDDAQDFRPERWLEAVEEDLKIMERTFMGFSRGKRVCLGQNVALMSMKKLLPMLIMCYNVTLADKNAPLEANNTAAVAFVESLLVKMERRV